MTFEDALKAMREGKSVQRKNGYNSYFISCGQIVTNYNGIGFYPMPISSEDILAEDWEVINEY